MLENISGFFSNAANSATGTISDIVNGIIHMIMTIIDHVLFKVAVMIPFPLFVLLLVMIFLMLLSAAVPKLNGKLLFVGAWVILFCGILLFEKNSAFAAPIFQQQINDLTAMSWVGKVAIENATSDKVYEFFTAKSLIITSPVALFFTLFMFCHAQKTLASQEIGFIEKVVRGIVFEGGLILLGMWLLAGNSIIVASAPQSIAKYIFAMSWI